MSIFSKLQQLGATVENARFSRSDKDSGEKVSQKLDIASWSVITDPAKLAVAVAVSSEPAKIASSKTGASGTTQSAIVGQMLAIECHGVCPPELRDSLQISVLRAQLAQSAREEATRQSAIRESLMEESAQQAETAELVNA